MKTTRILFLLIIPMCASLRAQDDCTCGTNPPSKTVSSSPAEIPAARQAGIDVGGCYGKPVPEPAPATVGHPLKGVVLDVLADKSALLVKHEEIPGVMKAMTMLLKVDAATSLRPPRRRAPPSPACSCAKPTAGGSKR